jgi:hypothetical protein
LRGPFWYDNSAKSLRDFAGPLSRPFISPWGARDCGGNPFLRRGRKKDWSGKPGFWRLRQKCAHVFLDLSTVGKCKITDPGQAPPGAKIVKPAFFMVENQ